jgi:3-methylcrotonyl-CoA carboxylase alpha subunit
VKVSAGDSVDAGQVVVVLESMKLFSSLKAEIAGIIADVSCQPGETVMAGKRLVLIEPQGEPQLPG